MNRLFGIALIVLAIAIAVIPTFTDCQSQGKSLVTSVGKEIPMKCHWTGIAEIGVAAPMVVMGIMTTTNRRKYNLMSMGILGVALGSLAIAFPAGLIGVCQTPTMICHTVMKPALMTLGTLAVVSSFGTIVISRKAKE